MSPRPQQRRLPVRPLVAAVLGVLALVVPLLAGLGPATPPGADAAAAPAAALASTAPNILLITTDDQAAGDLRWMPRTRRLLARQGVRFTDAVSPHPLCCPARVELLTGKYGHNSGVRHNTGRHGGYAAFRAGGNLGDNMAVWLSARGYRTALVGKFLNGYSPGRDGRPPGWHHWNPTTGGDYGYYGTTFHNDGRPLRNPRGYVTDQVAGWTARYIREYAAADRPFFIWASHLAPHRAAGPYVARRYGSRGWVPPVPAARHERLFPRAVPPSEAKPSYGERSVADKPGSQKRARQPARLRLEFRQRIRSLQAVDEANARLIRVLRRTGELANTYVVFLSDNGYLLGEHRLRGKNHGFEEDLRIPMLVRGPQIPAGAVRTQTATPLHLASTFLQIAGVPDPAAYGVDAPGLLDVLRANAPLGGTQLIQGGTHSVRVMRRPGSPVPGWLWRGVRTDRFVYTAWANGDEALYDLARDPYQLLNLVRVTDGRLRDPAYVTVLAELRRRYAALSACSGPAQCHPAGG